MTVSMRDKDLLEATIGNFGRWQARISILMALLKFPIAWFQLGIVFLAPPTQFWCKQPEDFKNIPVSDWIKLISPDNVNNKTNHHVSNRNFYSLSLSIFLSFNSLLRLLIIHVR